MWFFGFLRGTFHRNGCEFSHAFMWKFTFATSKYLFNIVEDQNLVFMEIKIVYAALILCYPFIACNGAKSKNDTKKMLINRRHIIGMSMQDFLSLNNLVYDWLPVYCWWVYSLFVESPFRSCLKPDCSIVRLRQK